MSADKIDHLALVREIDELLGVPTPGVNGRVGFTQDPAKKSWNLVLGRDVESVATSDLL